MTPKKLLVFISTQFESKANPEYAKQMSAYMKNKFPFYGVKGENRKQILKEVKVEAKSCSIDVLLELTLMCWDKAEREYHQISIDLLKWKRKQLVSDHLDNIEYLITHNSWWDTVDAIASNLVGEILQHDNKLQYKMCEKWISSNNIWLRRSVIIHQLKYKDKVDHELLFALIESQKGSKEFFINKACGWALRQFSKFRPHLVKDFIDLHEDLSGLTKREGMKYITK